MIRQGVKIFPNRKSHWKSTVLLFITNIPSILNRGYTTEPTTVRPENTRKQFRRPLRSLRFKTYHGHPVMSRKRIVCNASSGEFWMVWLHPIFGCHKTKQGLKWFCI